MKAKQFQYSSGNLQIAIFCHNFLTKKTLDWKAFLSDHPLTFLLSSSSSLLLSLPHPEENNNLTTSFKLQIAEKVTSFCSNEKAKIFCDKLMTNYRVLSLLALQEQNWEKMDFLECLQLLLAFGPERYNLARRFVNCNKLNQQNVALILAENYVKSLMDQLLTSDKTKQLSETEFLEYTSICTVSLWSFLSYVILNLEF